MGQAVETIDNFLQFVDKTFRDGTISRRVISNFMTLACISHHVARRSA